MAWALFAGRRVKEAAGAAGIGQAAFSAPFDAPAPFQGDAKGGDAGPPEVGDNVIARAGRPARPNIRSGLGRLLSGPGEGRAGETVVAPGRETAGDRAPGRGRAELPTEASTAVARGRRRWFPAKAAAADDDDVSAPALVEIQYLRGVTRARDAEQVARGHIEAQFSAPSAAWYALQPWREGIVIEMQEGGGRAYLPALLAQLDRDSRAVCALPMAGRVMTVRIDEDSDMLTAVLLAHGQAPDPVAVPLLPVGPMKAYEQRGVGLLAAGRVMTIVGLICFTAALALLLTRPGELMVDRYQTTAARDLPVMKFDEMARAVPDGGCVAKAEFVGGTWRYAQGHFEGDRCVAGVLSGSTDPLVPGQVLAPGEGSRPVAGPQEGGGGAAARSPATVAGMTASGPASPVSTAAPVPR